MSLFSRSTASGRGNDERRYKYERLGREDDLSSEESSRFERVKRFGLFVIMVLALGFVAVLLVSGAVASPPSYGGAKGCDTVQSGYQCQPQISHFWGQYSPYFSVESSISNKVPVGCSITFAQVLSRHGARDPTASKTTAYNATIQKVHANAKSYPGKYAFLKDYEYTLGADQLTLFGEQEMINSGTNYYQRYQHLASKATPFIRSASEERVVESAQKWTQGFHRAKVNDRYSKSKDSAYPYPMVIISEDPGYNNTLSHDLCPAFEDGPDSEIASSAQKIWSNIFVPPIQARLNSDLGGANLTITEVIYMMDLCPFETVAASGGAISPFCSLFTESEWHQYNYYETLNKYYGYSHGNPLGPTQGVGFVNELIARMTKSPVQDSTSTNHTLDDNPATFPLDRKLYADFSHDNDMTAIYAALGLYNISTTGGPLPNTTIVEAEKAGGFSAAWTVPFAARVHFEKMSCLGEKEELVRVIVNDRVVPLEMCGADRWGRCRLTKFVESLRFARSGGRWSQCFV